MLNKVLLVGRLVQDPVVRVLPSGAGAAEFTVAWERRYRAGEEWKKEVGFFDCKAYGRLASIITERTNKGDLVIIEGRLTQERWTDKEGKQASRIRILVERMRKIASPALKEPVAEEELQPAEEEGGEEEQE